MVTKTELITGLELACKRNQREIAEQNQMCELLWCDSPCSPFMLLLRFQA
ncbi:hypothetical protein DAPPUDRAFT_235887 [Daphnia pulex]|uniref:Uncharacterized protein n=1 Tax=Daphnia pulex TaxID=6669 RepID=E9FZB4_DAPPU|nr:hypothetical protein DAPPUDRAFT_235887 [Daphnia pulex]|eukprot:EFX87293.1 hypothetical protein DAPPUDRAFT_235887 [Daphnia pulex]